MNSWTRTLNIDDAHTLLALAAPGLSRDAWVARCHDALPELSVARRREVIRLLRDGFLEWRQGALSPDGFLAAYRDAPAMAQLDLLQVAWALSHPLPLVVAEQLVAPALAADAPAVALDDLDALVAEHLETSSRESLRKTRTTVIGALEGVGALTSRGTGQHRSLHPHRGEPHPVAYAFLVQRDLASRGALSMMRAEAVQTSLPCRLTCCTEAHAEACLEAAVDAGLLRAAGDEVLP